MAVALTGEGTIPVRVPIDVSDVAVEDPDAEISAAKEALCAAIIAFGSLHLSCNVFEDCANGLDNFFNC